MRHAKASLLIALAVLFLSPKPALAQWDIIKWIQELSGPGPFSVYGVDVNFACSNRERRVSTKSTTRNNPTAYKYLFCDKRPYEWRDVEFFLGVNYGTGDGENNLDFAAGVPKNDKVTVSIYSWRAAYRPHAAIDVGYKGGFMRFTATPTVTTTKYFLDPYVAIRPVCLITCFKGDLNNRAVDAITKGFEVTAGVMFFPQGFTVQDFGAVGGPTLEGKAEASPHWGIKYWFTF